MFVVALIVLASFSAWEYAQIQGIEAGPNSSKSPSVDAYLNATIYAPEYTCNMTIISVGGISGAGFGPLKAQ
jgi:hypothetical protein